MSNKKDANFAVWVGGVELDHYMTREQAERTAQSWRDEGYVEVAIEDTHNCLEAEWRYLDCDECDTCEIRICVECGKDVDEPQYEFTSKEAK